MKKIRTLTCSEPYTIQPTARLIARFLFVWVCETLAIWQRAILNCSTHLKNALYKNPEMKKLPAFFFLFEKGEATHLLFTAT